MTAITETESPDRSPIEVYVYDKVTGEYLGKSHADPDPMDNSNWLIPAGATTEEPPQTGSEEVAVRIGGKYGSWEIKIDKRGTEYWMPDRSKHVIKEIGEDLPSDALLEEPPLSEEELQKQKGITEHQWVKSELNAVSIELMYHWTDDHRASHTEQAWKDYAIALRDYTSTDADGNPIMTGESRPSIEDFIETT